jgi:hypothetical protein
MGRHPAHPVVAAAGLGIGPDGGVRAGAVQ